MKTLTFYILICLLVSCSQHASTEKTAESRIGKFNSIKLGNVMLDVPANWKQLEPSSEMRKFEFMPEGSSSPVAGFYFGNGPMYLEANVDRWKNQFISLDKDETIKLKNTIITFVKLKGVYKDKPNPMASEFTEKQDYTMLAAIVPTDAGAYFFKMVGPEKEVEKEQKNFTVFLESYRVL